MAAQYPLASVHITTNHPDGTATFLPALEHPTQHLGPTHQLTYIYCTPTSPFSASTNADIDFWTEVSAIRPLSIFPAEGGSAAVIVDFAPLEKVQEHFMHQTNTVDYVVVLEGSVELGLEGGEKRVLKRGEVVIQRSVWHSLGNASFTESARIFAVAVGEKGAVHGAMEGRGPGGPPGGPPAQ